MDSIPSSAVPSERVVLLWDHAARIQGDYVLYWMTATRRAHWNFALDRARELAEELSKPLLILEALRVDYAWASDRLHRCVLQGMAQNEREFAASGALYYPYVERVPGEGKGLLRRLAKSACCVVTDDSPAFFLPSMLASARLDVEVRFEAIDSNGLLPLRVAPKAFARAHDFRRFLQRELSPHLSRWPESKGLAGHSLRPCAKLPESVTKRWPRAQPQLLEASPQALSRLPIEHAVGAVQQNSGSAAAALDLERFLEQRLAGYDVDRNRLDVEGTSGLSAHLHFGHLSTHQIFASIVQREAWSPARLGDSRQGKREGWWGMQPNAEAYLDQLVTWRELGFNNALRNSNFGSYTSLPSWARKTLGEHRRDKRPYLYELEQFEAAATHDELWNAAQEQLRQQGVMHGYLRMLWGKQILHWSADPEQAHAIMVELNNKYALDGRDPNSNSGILWTLGQFDRAWGPERPVYGKVRYMTSANTRRKLRVQGYLQRWNPVQGAS